MSTTPRLAASAKMPGVLALVLGGVGLVVGFLGVTVLDQLSATLRGPSAGTIWSIELGRALSLTLLALGLMIGGGGMVARKPWGRLTVVGCGFALALLYAFYLLVYFTYVKALLEGVAIVPQGFAQRPQPRGVAAGVLLFGILFLGGGAGIAMFALTGTSRERSGAGTSREGEPQTRVPTEPPRARKARKDDDTNPPFQSNRQAD